MRLKRSGYRAVRRDSFGAFPYMILEMVGHNQFCIAREGFIWNGVRIERFEEAEITPDWVRAYNPAWRQLALEAPDGFVEIHPVWVFGIPLELLKGPDETP